MKTWTLYRLEFSYANRFRLTGPDRIGRRREEGYWCYNAENKSFISLFFLFGHLDLISGDGKRNQNIRTYHGHYR